MENRTTVFFKVVLLGATYHLVRDILQIIGVQNIFTQIGHVDHEWCVSMYCDYVTFPVEIFIIVASIVVIKRRRCGVLGLVVIFSLLISLVIWLWQ
jgi:hypothetical protein